MIQANSLDWLDDSRDSTRLLDSIIIQEFLLGTPALDVSYRSRGFINRFAIKDSADAETLFAYLMDGVNYFPNNSLGYASSASEVEKLLEERDLLDGRFWLRGEFAVFVVSSRTKTQVSSIVEQMSSNNHGLKAQKRKLVKKKFELVDSLFRHIRNSLAHGSFQVVATDAGDAIILQDSNEKGEVSSRMVFRISRLQEWITEFRRFEATGV